MDGRGTCMMHVNSSKYEMKNLFTKLKWGNWWVYSISSYLLELLLSAPQTITSHFQSVDTTEFDRFIHDQENRNTLKKTFGNMNLLKSFLGTQIENSSIETMPPSDLNNLLCKFFLGVRKPDGSNYEPNTLRSFMSSFDRHLRKMEYCFQIISNIEFYIIIIFRHRQSVEILER